MSQAPWHTVVVVPTYNERTNLPILVAQVMQDTPYSMLVVDDASPDGTGEVAETLTRRYPGRVAVLHRSPPRGLGRSYLDGMRRALELGAELVCQMDADLSHDPEYLSALVAASGNADVVVGSRYLTGVSVANWPLHRLMLSVAANRYVRMITGLPVRDVTSGFKCWRRKALLSVLDMPLRSGGYALQFEMLFYAAQDRQRIVEVPIIFIERREGASKMSGRVIRESALRPLQLILTNRSRVPLREPASPRAMTVR
jgi:dolichol-phosphate mannosyltransferase